MIITTIEEVENLKEIIFDNAQKAFEQMRMKIGSLPAVPFLAEIKFDKVGIDPLRGTDLNFMEQLNQMFSDLVVLEGAASLLSIYPDKALKLNFGAASGFDIESIDGEVVAECFAVTTVASNRKLEKDCSKLMSKASNQKKHIYFYSRNDSNEKLQRLYEKYSEIVFFRITGIVP